MTLASLPPELIRHVLSHCHHASRTALVLTCKLLNSYRQHTPHTMQDLLYIERWPCYDLAGTAGDVVRQPLGGFDCFACSYCRRIRSAVKFTNAMMKGKRGKHSAAVHSGDTCRLTRFCIDCGIQRGRYKRGETFYFGGARCGGDSEDIGGGRGLVCVACGCFGRICNERVQGNKVCIPCAVHDTA